ncbi:PREDICTED: F-box protein SKIP23-like [Nelumbo nucifera]|uniref:F-box protein SKIP23-like n=2 Tax=Nelumbo nucifera TaxID=4432 RepID=A0A1U8B120_NELNU|nr:PREDICTED: F-box protein SKIP23-like [Nelumbo nucifera]DAD21273.1 TPA_asm: hypothetical protein HUJ06_022736 [Nelumbo nucifera]
MITHGEQGDLAFCRAGDESWTILRRGFRPYDDIIYHKERFYTLGNHGGLDAWDVSSSSPKRTVIAQVPPVLTGGRVIHKRYLVESSGDLLLVLRHDYFDDDANSPSQLHRTGGFKVFKLEERSSMNPRWVEVKSIGDRVLFLGDNYSVSISAREFPECSANCIYFTDDNGLDCSINTEWGVHDLGIFNIQEKTIQSCYPTESLRIIGRSVWVTPSL